MPGRNFNPVKIFMIDSVGAHRGMHYYNFALVSALNRLGTDTEMLSTLETAKHTLRPDNVRIRPGFNGIYGDKPQWLRGLYYVLALLRIIWWAYREKPDIVHFHFYQIPVLDYILVRCLKALGIQSVTTVHDVLPFERGTDFVSERGKIYHRLYNASSGLILNSQRALDFLAKLDPALLDKSTVIAQGGYLEVHWPHYVTYEEAKRKIGVEHDTPIILVFGTIKPNKRLDLIITSMAHVSKNYPRAKLVIAGRPQDRDIISDMALAEQLGVAAHIFWHPEYVADDDLVNYFVAADVVVFPYQWIYQSAALLMAMSFGKAVVATAVDSNIDVINHGKTGLLVSVDDAKGMAAAIEQILGNPAYGLAIGKAASQYIAHELSWDTIASSTLNFYCQLLEKG